jgi:hypothetical protein
MRERALARLIPLRPWIALSNFLLGAALTVPGFYTHDLLLATIGLVILGGALFVLLIPLPYPR